MSAPPAQDPSEPAETPAGSPSPSAPPEAALSVAAVARRLGVAPATLRTWDRRYALGPSGHTAGAHRRYTPADLERLTLMRRLTLDGVAPAEAARVALATPSADPVLDAAPSPAGGGRVLALPGGSAATRGLARAAMALDDHACRHLVQSALEAVGVVRAWQELLVPVLTTVGERWAETGEGIEVEHLLSEVAMSIFRPISTSVTSPINGRPVLLACVEDEQHSLPLYVFGAALAERRVSSRLLGAQIPARALSDAVRRSGPAVILLWSQLPGTADAEILAAIPAQRPAPYVFTGGPGWLGVDLPPGAEHLRDLSTAVDTVVGAVTARRL